MPHGSRDPRFWSDVHKAHQVEEFVRGGGVADPNNPFLTPELRALSEQNRTKQSGRGGGSNVPEFLKSSEAKEKEDAEALRSEIAAATDPAELVRRLRFLLPLFREDVASGFGPQFEQALQGKITSGGFRNTGLGETLSVVGAGIPEIEAFRRALSAAQQSQALQVGAFQNQAFAPQGGGDSLQRFAQFAGALKQGVDFFRSFKEPKSSGNFPEPGDFDPFDPFDSPFEGSFPV